MNPNPQQQQEQLQYDENFVRMLQELDPTEVTDELILAANSAILQQEKARSRWARRGVFSASGNAMGDTEDPTTPGSGTPTTSAVDNNGDDDSVSSSSSEEEEDDDDGASSSAASLSSSLSNDDGHDSAENPRREEGKRDSDDVATAFCRSFLSPDGAVEQFVRDVRATAQTLQALRATVKRFARRIDGVASEVGVLQAKAKETERSLVNTHNVRQLTSAAIEALMPCQDMARLLSSAVVSADEDAGSGSSSRRNVSSDDLPEMGRQVVHAVRQLEQLLAARQVRVLNVAAAAQHGSGSSSSTSSSASPTATHREEKGKEQQEEAEKNNKHPSTTTPGASSSSSCLVLDLRKAPSLEAVSSHVVDSLARQTCLLVRNFLVPRVAVVLGKQRTNITIQQRSSLLPYRALVKFLKSCATNPEFLAMKSNSSGGAGGNVDDGFSSLPVVSAAEAASAFYTELRLTYIHYAACVYVGNFQRYIAECLSLQQPRMFRPLLQKHRKAAAAAAVAGGGATTGQHQSATSAATAASSVGGGGGGGGGWFDWLGGSSTTTSTTGGAQLQNKNHPHVPTFPTLADVAANVQPGDFSSRFAAVAQDVQAQILSAHPILPMVQKGQLLQLQQQQQQQHQQSNSQSLAEKRQAILNNPIETFRSMQQMLCDVVTSEFLFSFEFFDGDTDVYSGVFKPVMDVMVQFVMANFLPSQPRRSASSSSGGGGGGGAVDSTDVVGLGLLSLIAITFRREMHSRSLHCLDEFYSHVLALLLPSMTRAVELQHQSLRSLMIEVTPTGGGATSPAGLSPATTPSRASASPASSFGSERAANKNNSTTTINKDAHLHSLDLFMRVNGIAGNATSLLSSTGTKSSSSASSTAAVASLLLHKPHPVVDRFAHLFFVLRSVLLRMSLLYGGGSGSSFVDDVPLGGTATSHSHQHHSPGGLHRSTPSKRATKSTTPHPNDDVEEMLSALCGSCKSLSVDFTEWLRTFSKFFVRSCFARIVSGVRHQQQQGQRGEQPIPEHMESVFLVRNLGALLQRWAELGFAARVAVGHQNEDEDDDDVDATTDEHHHNKRRNELPPLSASSSNTNGVAVTSILPDPTAEFVAETDSHFHQSYEDAVETLAYDILQHLMGDVIISVRDAEVKIQDFSSSSAAAAENVAIGGGSNHLPPHLETSARRFTEGAKDVPKKIADFCQRALTLEKPDVAQQQQNHHQFHHPLLDRMKSIDTVLPQLDVMKKTFTQLLLWNTRLHAALGVFLGGRQQQQRLRGMTVSNVQLSQWMQLVL